MAAATSYLKVMIAAPSVREETLLRISKDSTSSKIQTRTKTVVGYSWLSKTRTSMKVVTVKGVCTSRGCSGGGQRTLIMTCLVSSLSTTGIMRNKAFKGYFIIIRTPWRGGQPHQARSIVRCTQLDSIQIIKHGITTVTRILDPQLALAWSPKCQVTSMACQEEPPPRLAKALVTPWASLL